MLRIVLLSVLLGAGACTALLGIGFAPSNQPREAADPVTLTGHKLNTKNPKLEESAEGIRAQFNERGNAMIILSTESLTISETTVFRLHLGKHADNLTVALGWRKPETGKHQYLHRLGTRPQAATWIPASEIPDLLGEAQKLSVILKGEPGTFVEFNGLDVRQYSLFTQIRILIADRFNFEPWRRDAINSYSGASNITQYYPAPLVATLMGFSLLAYAGIAVVRFRTLRIDWREAGLIIMFCWLLMDLPWQYNLLRQAHETTALFSDKSDEEKLASGPDAELYRSVSAALAAIPESDARIFVAAADKYTGLRAAYYFYPHNVFWDIHGWELPYHEYLQDGDYIFLTSTSAMELRPRAGALRSGRGFLQVEVLTSDEQGSLLRLRLD